MHFGDNTMKISELLEEKRDTHCSDKCCGSDVKAEDCKCPPDCPHCNCNANLDEMTSAGDIAGSMGGGNGFANGIGTMQRRGKKPAKKKKR